MVSEPPRPLLSARAANEPGARALLPAAIV